ncbi:hypothetical protein F0919_06975 [Taibaiella lutea]|uniref:Outer membrane protein beta-barrel domain-containing protein n=1 Tax=Taibaiella lutea TaxID=2608001 RepID=A0A5M6CQ61_9BACT|nr:hypothetical protein [Taibaiella lutea]KAA5537411.1 hypothetical protein F0919_06975 [Taibaiella lutea]
MKKAILSLFALTTAWAVGAQGVSIKTKDDGRFLYGNSIHFEAGGHGLVYSLNYERNIINTRHFKTSMQVGLSLYPGALDLVSNVWIPYSINQLFSLNQHHIETGIGLVLTQSANGFAEGRGINKYFNTYYSAKIGYRYQKPNGRMTYKVLFTPLWEKIYNYTEFHPLGAFSIGYNF